MKCKEDVRKLIVIAKVRRIIESEAMNVRVSGLGLDYADVVSEGYLTVLQVYRMYSERVELSRLIAMCVVSVRNRYAYLIRLNAESRYSGKVDNLFEAYYKCDYTTMPTYQRQIALHDLLNVLEGREELVMRLYIDPPDEFKNLIAGMQYRKKKSVIITAKMIAFYLDDDCASVRRCLLGAKRKVVQHIKDVYLPHAEFSLGNTIEFGYIAPKKHHAIA
jgi:hypothetical protein